MRGGGGVALAEAHPQESFETDSIGSDQPPESFEADSIGSVSSPKIIVQRRNLTNSYLSLKRRGWEGKEWLKPIPKNHLKRIALAQAHLPKSFEGHSIG